MTKSSVIAYDLESDWEMLILKPTAELIADNRYIRMNAGDRTTVMEEISQRTYQQLYQMGVWQINADVEPDDGDCEDQLDSTFDIDDECHWSLLMISSHKKLIDDGRYRRLCMQIQSVIMQERAAFGWKIMHLIREEEKMQEIANSATEQAVDVEMKMSLSPSMNDNAEEMQVIKKNKKNRYFKLKKFLLTNNNISNI